jgi:hypothetical protein
MKTFLHKHKVLLITLSAVLCLSILSGLLLGGVIKLSENGGTFATVADTKAEAEKPAKSAEAGKESENGSVEDLNRPEPTPSPAAQGAKFSAEQIKWITEDVQRRRERVIPIRSDIWIADNRFLWTASDPTEEQRAAVCEEAERLTQILFGESYAEFTGYETDHAYTELYTDASGERDAFLITRDPAGVYILALRASDYSLICADLLTYPEGKAVDREKENIALAEQLGYHAKPVQTLSGMQFEYASEVIYAYKTDTDVCMTFAYIGDKLWQVAVFPSQDAMLESEYFLADLQNSFSEKAYPQHFVEAEPPELDESKMANVMKIEDMLCTLYQDLSGEKLYAGNIQWTFYRDESGVREDCWELKGDGFAMIVSAYSRDVISFTGTIPCKDLQDVPYERWGEKEYEDATTIIAQDFICALGMYGPDETNTHGKGLKEVSVNAVVDGIVCTMDIELEDGTWYECEFRNGVLKEIWHFANVKLFMEGPMTGWVADAVYINSVTGKPFIPYYRDWDGDFHVTARPEN